MLLDEIKVKMQKEGLKLIEDDNTGKLLAMIVGNEICISKKVKTVAQKTECVSHEYGHNKTTPDIDVRKQPKDVQDRIEYRATRYGVLSFITLERLLQAYKKGCRTCWEYCEELGITEQFFLQVAHIQSTVYGIKTVYDDKWLFEFTPLRIRKIKKDTSGNITFDEWE